MKIISNEEFLATKSSDTVVILGCGYSINRIRKEQWDRIGSVNSIGFNWFCHHDFGPTFFAIREQANNRTRNVQTETRKALFRDVNKPSYINTCMVVHRSMLKQNYCYAKNCDKIHGKGVIVKDRKAHASKKLLKSNILKTGVVHGRISLTNALHIALFLKYKKIIFAGVDLYNSRYFWLSKSTTRANIQKKGLNFKHKHPSYKYAIPLVRLIKNNFKVEMTVANKQSLLREIIPYEKI